MVAGEVLSVGGPGIDARCRINGGDGGWAAVVCAAAPAAYSSGGGDDRDDDGDVEDCDEGEDDEGEDAVSRTLLGEGECRCCSRLGE